MKRLLFVLIALFQTSLLSLKAEDIDSLLLKHYQNSYKKMMSIIEDENLSDSLQGYPFYVVHFYDVFWTIVVEKQHKTVLYYRNFNMKSYQSLHFSKEIRELNRMYSLLDLDMSNNKRRKRSDYNPFYSYCAIFNMNHETVFEWNSETIFTKHEKKIRKTIRKTLSFLYTNTDVIGL